MLSPHPPSPHMIVHTARAPLGTIAALWNCLGYCHMPPNLPFCVCLGAANLPHFADRRRRPPASHFSTGFSIRVRINCVHGPARALGRAMSITLHRGAPRGRRAASRHRAASEKVKIDEGGLTVSAQCLSLVNTRPFLAYKVQPVKAL